MHGIMRYVVDGGNCNGPENLNSYIVSLEMRLSAGGYNTSFSSNGTA